MEHTNLVVFDIETTGLDRSRDHIIQFAGIKIDKETGTVLDKINLKIKPVGPYQITLSAYFKHGVTPKDLENEKTFVEVADQITEFFKDADVLTYNGNRFDIPFLISEYNKYGLKAPNFMECDVYDAFLEEKRRNGNTLSETFQRYNNGKSMEDAGLTAHDALSDVLATYNIYYNQQKDDAYGPEKMYGEDDVVKDMEFCGHIKPCFSIGKYSGISVEYVALHDKSYMSWAINKSNFVDSTKKYLATYMDNKS